MLSRNNFPISSVIVRASSFFSCSSSDAAAIIKSARRENGSRRCFSKAATARFSRFSISASSCALNSFSFSPVAGLIDAIAIWYCSGGLGFLQSQPFRNQNAIKQVEKQLHQQRQDRGRNCALQNRRVIVQIQSADDRFTESSGADQC